MALTTLADIKIYLGIPPANTDQDILLTMFKDSVEQQIINLCDTDFTSTVVTNEILDGLRSDTIVPKNFPIISVQGVHLDVYVDGTGGYILDPTRDYSFSESAIILRTVNSPLARRTVRVDYTWGYATVPADVKMAVYQSVKAELQRHGRNTEDIASRSKGDESENYGGGSGPLAVWDKASGLPVTVVAKLQNYKTFEFPTSGMAQRST